MGFKRHDFDEPDDDAFLAEKLREGNDLVVVESAQQHAIYLDLVEAGAWRREAEGGGRGVR